MRLQGWEPPTVSQHLSYLGMNGSSAGGDIMFLNFHVTSHEHRFTGLYGVVVITITQVYKTKPELSLCAGLNPASGVSEIGDGKNL